jgi:predicted ATPase
MDRVSLISNLISGFKLLRWMMQSPGKLQFFIGQAGGANSLLFNGSSVTPQMEAEFHFETESGRNDYFCRLFHGAPDTLIFADERYRFSRNTFNGLADWTLLDAGHKEAKLIEINNLGDPTARTIFRLMQGCAVYQFHNTSDTARVRQRWNIEDSRYLREDAANLAPFLLRLKETEPIYYKIIVETLQQIALFFADFVLEAINNSVMLQWSERDTDLVFSAHQVSDGTLRTIALLTLLLQPPGNLPEVLILDEPELR